MLLLYLGWELCVAYNYPFFASPIFQNSEVNTLLSKHCSHKWLWGIYMRSTHCTSRKCIPCNIGDIISNLLLSRAYFPHLFHIISAKAKKLQLLSENLQEVAAVGWAYFAICHLLKYAQGQRLTHAVAISRWDLTLAHAVMLPKYAQKKNSPGPGEYTESRLDNSGCRSFPPEFFLWKLEALSVIMPRAQ